MRGVMNLYGADNSQRNEDLKNLYVYTDNSIKRITYQCFASSIMEADKLVCEALGIRIDKSAHIGCQIVFNWSDVEECEIGYYGGLCCGSI